MAIQFLSGLDVDGNITLQNSAQLKSARIDNRSSDPTGSTGRIYYNTSKNKLRLYNGSWVDLTTGADDDTKYDFNVPTGTTTLRLAGTDGTNDDVTIAGSGLISVTRASATQLTISTTATSNTGTVTNVVEGKGIKISGTSTVTPTVNVDYEGTDNAILAATAASPVGADTIWFSDDTDNEIKKATISSFPGFGKDGTVTSVATSGGLTGGTITSSGTLEIDYTGTDNLILSAGNGTSVTLADADQFIFSDDTDDGAKRANLSQLATYINAGAGSVTSVGVSGGSTGMSFSNSPITTSGTMTMSGTLDVDNGGTGLSSYTTGDILYASGGSTLAKLAIGSAGQVLKVSGGIPSWQADSNSGGTVTSITLAADSGTGSAITSSGTFTFDGGTNVTTSVSGTTVTINSTDQYQGTVTSIATPSDGGLTGGTITSSGSLRLKNYSALSANKVMQWDNTNNQLTNAPITISGNNATLTGDLTVSGGDITLSGTGRIQGIDTVTAATDAASKNYVDQQLAGSGLLLFQGGYNAATNTPDLDSSPSSSIKKGWSYVVTADGSFFSEQVRVGDLLIAQQDAPTTLAHWVTVQNNIDLATTTTPGIASFSSSDFAVSAAGEVTIKTGGVSDSQLASTFNKIIGTDSDINTSGVIVIDQLNMTDGVIQSHSTRTLPDSTTSARGVTEIATQSEVDTGTDSFRYVTPATLKAHIDKQSFSGTYPSASASSWTITAAVHGLGASQGPFIIQTFDNKGVQVYMDVAIAANGDVTFTTTNNQSTNAITCNLMKVR